MKLPRSKVNLEWIPAVVHPGGSYATRKSGGNLLRTIDDIPYATALYVK